MLQSYSHSAMFFCGTAVYSQRLVSCTFLGFLPSWVIGEISWLRYNITPNIKILVVWWLYCAWDLAACLELHTFLLVFQHKLLWNFHFLPANSLPCSLFSLIVLLWPGVLAWLWLQAGHQFPTITLLSPSFRGRFQLYPWWSIAYVATPSLNYTTSLQSLSFNSLLLLLFFAKPCLFCNPMDCNLPFPSPGYLPNLGIKPTSPSWQADSLLLSHLCSSQFLTTFSQSPSFSDTSMMPKGEPVNKQQVTIQIFQDTFFKLVILTQKIIAYRRGKEQ